jgi:pilus assembly protein CpaB
MQRQQNAGRTRAGLFLVGSLFLALVASGLVFRIVKRSEQQLAEAQRPKETLDVVIAARDLVVGNPISEEDVVVRAMVPGMVAEEGIFSTLDEVIGRTPRERILANEPVRDERIARPDQGIGLNAIVTPGKRAMTVATNTEDAVAGLLQPGNYVDIIVTIKPEDPSAVGAKWVTDTILQTLKVLAVGSSLGGPPVVETKRVTNTADGKKKVETVKRDPKDTTSRKLKPSITLEVTPDEAEKLALAVAQGDIYVVLRSDIDTLQYADHGIKTSATLIGLPTAPLPVRPTVPTGTVPAKPDGPSAVVIQGSQRIDVQFHPDGTTESTSGKKEKGSR